MNRRIVFLGMRIPTDKTSQFWTNGNKKMWQEVFFCIINYNVTTKRGSKKFSSRHRRSRREDIFTHHITLRDICTQTTLILHGHLHTIHITPSVCGWETRSQISTMGQRKRFRLDVFPASMDCRPLCHQRFVQSQPCVAANPQRQGHVGTCRKIFPGPGEACS